MKVLIPVLWLLFISYLTLAQDHKDNLSGPFENVQQVTEECLMCHEDSGTEILASNHWNWLTSNLAASLKPGNMNGKHIPINNFCIAVPENLTECNTCHLASNGKDESFDFNAAENIDCLVCHDQTGN